MGDGVEYNGVKADIWSCGVILYALVAGKLPFDDNDLGVVLQKVKKGVYETPSGVSDEIQDLMAKMLVVSPEERISIEDIREHAWYKQNITSVESPVVPTKKIEKSCRKIEGDKNNDFIKTISDLGFGDTSEIETDLESDTESYIKTLYEILENRVQNKRFPTPEKSKSKLNRAKSEAMLPLSRVSKTFRTSSNQLGNSLRGKEHKRMGSVNTIEKSPSKELTSSAPSKSTKDKKARFLPSWFGSSDSHLKKELGKDIIESSKPLAEITTEIEETLDSMDSTYSFSRKRDKVKAKITRDSKSIRFYVHIGKAPGHSETTPLYAISFSRRGGDKDVYNQVCDNIRRLLDV